MCPAQWDKRDSRAILTRGPSSLPKGSYASVVTVPLQGGEEAPGISPIKGGPLWEGPLLMPSVVCCVE